MGEKLRVSKEEARRVSVKLAEMEADRAALERQTENDADVTADRVRAAGQRITELQGKLNQVLGWATCPSLHRRCCRVPASASGVYNLSVNCNVALSVYSLTRMGHRKGR